MGVGSSDWFHQMSLSEEIQRYQQYIEDKRAEFVEKYSPEKLAVMDGEVLLSEMFGEGNSMRWLLNHSEEYKPFGSTARVKYTGIIYPMGDTWTYNPKTAYPLEVTREEAVNYAEQVRDRLVECVDVISNWKLNTVQDYAELCNRLKTPSYSVYMWILKYYQMFFPYFFPGMYGSDTLSRATEILGLPDHGKSLNKRFQNIGEISLFIRRCDINNMVFNKIFENQFGWTDEMGPCDAAEENWTNRGKTPKDINIEYYTPSLNQGKQEEERIRTIQSIDQEINDLNINGAEREAFVKVRVNQGVFRDTLIRKYGKCCLCGVTDPKLLIASHIKPWAEAEPNEKLDHNNGFLLCPNHDKLFDMGLISFDNDGKILISDNLSEENRIFMNVNENMLIDLSDGNRRFLDYHRRNVFGKLTANEK
ncbi:MAG: HNH endonuclease [Lachnospiraceae bacterium]|nr:HNH endonuclease [Lachnospiraceae bacterium]